MNKLKRLLNRWQKNYEMCLILSRKRKISLNFLAIFPQTHSFPFFLLFVTSFRFPSKASGAIETYLIDFRCFYSARRQSCRDLIKLFFPSNSFFVETFASIKKIETCWQGLNSYFQLISEKISIRVEAHTGLNHSRQLS